MSHPKAAGICILLCLCMLSSCSPIAPSGHLQKESSSQELSGKLTLNGSTSMSPLCDSLGEQFEEKYPQVKYEKSNNGSGAAAAAVENGTALLGDLSRDLTPAEEQGNRFEKKVIALDGIALIVHPSNPVQDLTEQQIRDIFSKKTTDWSKVGGKPGKIVCIGREYSSGTRDGFETIFHLQDACSYDAEFSEAGDVISKVSKEPRAIGYCSLSSISPSIQPLKVNGVAASEETIADGSYMVQRPFIEIYKREENNPLISAWFSFIASEEGKSIVRQQRLIPVL